MPIPIEPINPVHYYDARFVAIFRGLHLCTVYQSLSGAKRAALPRPTRFGREVKFLGQHILDFIAEHGGTVSSLAEAPPPVAKSQGRGRPRKVLRAAVGGAA